MTLLAHPRAVAWRNHLRGWPLLHRLYHVWVGRDYEERFARGLLAAIAPGDTVWDIGANVGLYTAQFLARQAAHVVCFEPAPAAVSQLETSFGAGTAAQDRVRIVPAALSNVRGTVRFAVDGSSPTNKIIDTEFAPSILGESLIEVPVVRGDEVAAELDLPLPNVIKIDVEGYEWEVLQGLERVLALPVVHAVFIEVHFALLHGRALDHAPAAINATLAQCGFDVGWLDPSHLCGTRRRFAGLPRST